MAAPHAIHEEFPNDADRSPALAIADAHFARLLGEYGQISDQIAGAERRQMPMSDAAKTGLRQQRAARKGQSAPMISGGAV